MHAPIPILLFTGLPRPEWPEPLAGLLAAQQFSLKIVPTLYQAAAALACPESRPLIRALLLDPRILMPRDLHAIDTFSRHMSIPLILLPIDQDSSPCARRAVKIRQSGILAWEAAAPTLPALAHAAPVQPVLSDKPILHPPHNPPEKPLTIDAPNRYDELGIQPLLSAQELAALLDESN